MDDWRIVERLVYFLGILIASSVLIIVTLIATDVPSGFINSLFLLVGVMIRELGNIIGNMKGRR